MVNGNNKAPFAGALIIEKYLMVQRNKINKALEAIEKTKARDCFEAIKEKKKDEGKNIGTGENTEKKCIYN